MRKFLDRILDELADRIADRLLAASQEPHVHIENMNVMDDDRFTAFERSLMAKRAQQDG
jgi:hypothetical protein